MFEGDELEKPLHIADYVVRSWRESDVPSLARHANNRKVWRNLRDGFPFPYTTADAKDWVTALHNPLTDFAIAGAEGVIGGIGFNLQEDVYHRSAEVGYWLGEPFWNHGIATRALQEVTTYAMADFGLLRLYAIVFEWNPASARVLEKNGFLLEGRMVKSVTKDGLTIDSLLYSLVNRP